MTMMNLSGEAVGPLMDYYNVDPEDLLVLYDDLDLPQGKCVCVKKEVPGVIME